MLQVYSQIKNSLIFEDDDYDDPPERNFIKWS